MTGTPRRAPQWRVRREFTALKVAGAGAFVILGAVAASDTRGLLLCLAAAVLLGAFALRDVLAPVRLSADTEGLTMVTGLVRRERVPWPEVQHIRVGHNARYGLRWELLEIETGEALHLFSSHELGTSCVEAAEELFRLRPA
jgi:hypothetical protein